jgi:DNA mismatch endonuclease, patch repair protein
MDTISPENRSRNMSRIRAKDTGPEVFVRRLVHSLGYRYRLYHKGLPGKPDLVFPGRKKIIFVQGCFWHQHEGCIDGRLPKSRVDYWHSKLQRNKDRDENILARLVDDGWGVLVVWECKTKNPDQLRKKIVSFLDGE